MKHISTLALTIALALPATAQDEPRNLLENFAEGMMRDLMEDVAPEFEQLMNEMLPRLNELADALGGLSNYELPEVLPNGDILIRRKKDAPPVEDLPKLPHFNADPIEL